MIELSLVMNLIDIKEEIMAEVGEIIDDKFGDICRMLDDVEYEDEEAAEEADEEIEKQQAKDFVDHNLCSDCNKQLFKMLKHFVEQEGE